MKNRQFKKYRFRVLGSILQGQRPVHLSVNVHALTPGQAWAQVGKNLDDSEPELEVREVRFIGEEKGSTTQSQITVY